MGRNFIYIRKREVCDKCAFYMDATAMGYCNKKEGPVNKNDKSEATCTDYKSIEEHRVLNRDW